MAEEEDGAVKWRPFRLPTRVEIDPSIPPDMAARIAADVEGEVVYHGEDDLWEKRLKRAKEASE